VIDNCGLRGIGLRHSNSDPSLWEVFVSIRNYGATPKNVSLGLQFGGSPSGIRNLTLPAAGEQSITFELRTRAAGWLEARLLTTDAFPGDDRATLELPQQELFRVAVFSDHPDWLKPVLEANPNIEAKFYKPVEYSEQAGAAVIILDRFRPASLPRTDSIWIEPPVESSPVRVLTKVRNVTVTRWVSESPIAMGLRVQDLRLGSAEVFDLARGDVAVAEIPEGPVIVARPAKPKMVVLGFHPVRSAMRYQLATPLMFANILRWMAPEVFRRWELNSGTVGTVTAAIDAETDPSGVRVLAEDRRVLPFTTDGQNVRFFAGTPATVRVLAGDRERVYSLTLPEVADSTWEPPSWAKRGIPATAAATASSTDLWQLLALLGGLGLFLDWLLFGQAKSGFRGVNVSTPGLRSFSFRGFVSSILRKAS
jgi:hypothetical protein